jgi:hypothetical protein
MNGLETMQAAPQGAHKLLRQSAMKRAQAKGPGLHQPDGCGMIFSRFALIGSLKGQA